MSETGLRDLSPITKKNFSIRIIIQVFNALSLACFSVAMGILVSVAITAIDSTRLDDRWLPIFVIMFFCAGGFLLLSSIFVVRMKPKLTLRSITLLLIPLLVLALGGVAIFLKYNFMSFHSYFGLAEYYGSYFTDQMQKVTSGIFSMSLLIIAINVVLGIRKLIAKKFKENIILFINTGLHFLVVITQIVVLITAKNSELHKISIQTFFVAVIVQAIITLISFALSIREINREKELTLTHDLESISSNLDEEAISRLDVQLTKKDFVISANIILLIGVVVFIAGTSWLLSSITNDRLVYFRLKTIPDFHFPEFTLTGIGSVLMTFGLFLQQKTMMKHKVKVLAAAILLALIIPIKLLSVFLVWFFSDPIYYSFGWVTSLKAIFIVITDIIPIILAQFLINYPTSQNKEKKWLFIWYLISSITIILTTTGYLLAILWPKFIGSSIDSNIWLSVFRNVSIISIVALSNMIAIYLVNTQLNKEENVIGK